MSIIYTFIWKGMATNLHMHLDVDCHPSAFLFGKGWLQIHPFIWIRAAISPPLYNCIWKGVATNPFSIWQEMPTNPPSSLGGDGNLFTCLFWKDGHQSTLLLGRGLAFMYFSIWKGWQPVCLSIWERMAADLFKLKWLCIILFEKGMGTRPSV